MLEGVEGTLVLTDTPGLSEIGEGGAVREAEARDLAARADLLLFVVDDDLVRAEHEPLMALARQGKRSIVVLNKTDRYPRGRRARDPGQAPRAAGRRRSPRPTSSPVAADPRPLPVRVRGGRRLRRDGAGGRAPGPRPLAQADRRGPRSRGRRPPRRQPPAASPPARPGGPGAAGQGARPEGARRGRPVPVDHRRDRLRQPDPGARPDGRRGGAVPDDLGDRRGLRRRAVDGPRPPDRRRR